MIAVLMAIALLTVAAGYWLIARRRAGPARAAGEPKKAGRFGAVEIGLRAGACEAARALEGQRFLASDAPALPLPGCAATKCTCMFAKLGDRRTDDRRFEHGGLGASMFLSTNRRQKRDRRARAKRPRDL